MSDITLTEKQMARLPLYARHEITRLAQSLAQAKADLRRCEVPGKTDTAIGRFGDENNVSLPNGARIVFGSGKWNERFHVRWCDDSLEVSSMSGALDVEPHVSNVIRVKNRRRP